MTYAEETLGPQSLIPSVLACDGYRINDEWPSEFASDFLFIAWEKKPFEIARKHLCGRNEFDQCCHAVIIIVTTVDNVRLRPGLIGA